MLTCFKQTKPNTKTPLHFKPEIWQDGFSLRVKVETAEETNGTQMKSRCCCKH